MSARRRTRSLFRGADFRGAERAEAQSGNVGARPRVRSGPGECESIAADGFPRGVVTLVDACSVVGHPSDHFDFEGSLMEGMMVRRAQEHPVVDIGGAAEGVEDHMVGVGCGGPGFAARDNTSVPIPCDHCSSLRAGEVPNQGSLVER